MENKVSVRNNVARHAWKFNKPKRFTPKKGKGSFVRIKRVDLCTA